MERSVVVTGAGQGIGRACFDRLLADGWFVVGIEVDEELAAQAEAAAGGRGAVVRGDVAERSTHLDGGRAGTRARAARRLGQQRGHRHAGDAPSPRRRRNPPRPGREPRRHDVGLRRSSGSFRRAAERRCDREHLVDPRPPQFANHAAYDTSKGGIDALTRNLAVEYGPIGVRVNAIAPGGIRTPLLERGIEREPRPGGSAPHPRVVPAAPPSGGAVRDRRGRRLPPLRPGLVRQRPVDRRRRRLDRNRRAPSPLDPDLAERYRRCDRGRSRRAPARRAARRPLRLHLPRRRQRFGGGHRHRGRGLSGRGPAQRRSPLSTSTSRTSWSRTPTSTTRAAWPPHAALRRGRSPCAIRSTGRSSTRSTGSSTSGTASSVTPTRSTRTRSSATGFGPTTTAARWPA